MSDRTKCWVDMIAQAMAHAKDAGPIIASHPPLQSAEMVTPFYTGFGGHEGCPFTAWTETRVYFPVVYDGAEWVESAPRHPCEEATGHVGGE